MSQLKFTDNAIEGLIVVTEIQRDAWKEAFIAIRSHYSNNTGTNAKRYREAVAHLKELKLLK